MAEEKKYYVLTKEEIVGLVRDEIMREFDSLQDYYATIGIVVCALKRLDAIPHITIAEEALPKITIPKLAKK